MEQRFLNYYHRELVFMREAASEFAHKHPKLAKRLNINNTLVADPWVERLIESFCFLNARTQLKIDGEFELFTQRLLNSLSPELTMPTPAMAVVQMLPSATEGELSCGYIVPAGTALFSQPLNKNKTRCEFRTRRSLTLWPFSLTHVQLSQLTPELAAQAETIEPPVKAAGALKLELSLPKERLFSQLGAIDELTLYLAGDEKVASQLFELLACHHTATAIVAQQKVKHVVHASDSPLKVNISDPQQDPPTFWQGHHGYRHLKAYFDCREQFQFLSLNLPVDCLTCCQSDKIEIWLLLDTFPSDLAPLVGQEIVRLYCVPVINLFPGKVDRIAVTPSMVKYHVLTDRSRPSDYEICLVTQVTGFSAHGKEIGKYRPMYHSQANDKQNYGRYFSLERAPCYSGERQGKHSAESDIWLSLVDQYHPPYPSELASLHLDALVSNKHLTRRLPCPDQEGIDLCVNDAIPTQGANFVSRITTHYDTTTYADCAWKLINLLNSTYHPLDSTDATESAEQLRERLALFIRHDDAFSKALIDSIVSLSFTPVIRRLPGDELLLNCRGIHCLFTIDESYFSGHSPYLFGAVIATFFADHRSINSFVELELHSLQRGFIARWPAIIGRRGYL